MCIVLYAAAVWWRRRQQIIADKLIIAGKNVRRIKGPSTIERAILTAASSPTLGGSLVYLFEVQTDSSNVKHAPPIVLSVQLTTELTHPGSDNPYAEACTAAMIEVFGQTNSRPARTTAANIRPDRCRRACAH